jgi:hypothetical protein
MVRENEAPWIAGIGICKEADKGILGMSYDFAFFSFLNRKLGFICSYKMGANGIFILKK